MTSTIIINLPKFFEAELIWSCAKYEKQTLQKQGMIRISLVNILTSQFYIDGVVVINNKFLDSFKPFCKLFLGSFATRIIYIHKFGVTMVRV